MFRTIQDEPKLDAFQQGWAYEAGHTKKTVNRSVQSFLYFLIGLVAPIGMMYRALANPELVNPTVINVIFFTSLIYIGMLFVYSIGLGFMLLVSGAFALKFNEAKRIDDLGSYKVLKSMVVPYTSSFKIAKTRFQQLLSLVFVLGCVMVGNWWTIGAVLSFLMVGWIHFCQRSCRNSVVNSLKLLTREVAEDFERGHETPSDTLIIDGTVIVDHSVEPEDDTRVERVYYYEAMDSTGLEIKDQISASNEAEAQEKVRAKGLYVTRIKLKDKK